jgi:predicted amidohydrolase
MICYMNIALVASETAWEDVDKNLELAGQHVRKVKELYPATDVILFPEISLAGFIERQGSHPQQIR